MIVTATAYLTRLCGSIRFASDLWDYKNFGLHICNAVHKQVEVWPPISYHIFCHSDLINWNANKSPKDFYFNFWKVSLFFEFIYIQCVILNPMMVVSTVYNVLHRTECDFKIFRNLRDKQSFKQCLKQSMTLEMKTLFKVSQIRPSEN